MVATMEDQRKSLAKKLYQISGESETSETRGAFENHVFL
jgi:hypothetical protein